MPPPRLPNECEPSLVGRLAPSPTGELHLGHARSFLLAWWSVRSRGGRLLLRIEDLDGERSRPELIASNMADLEWLGLDWDGEPLLQSADPRPRELALVQLAKRGLVYPCTCTRREVRKACSAPHASAGAYPGTCRGRYADLAEAEAISGRKAAWRFKVPTHLVPIEDRALGHTEFDLTQDGGDFVVARSDGLIGYQLAVVVDDAQAGVSEVLRGEDLASSAARQELLFEALGLRPPAWVHVPLVVGADGMRLAKRVASLSLGSLRAAGVSPSKVIAWAARSAGQPVPRHAGDLRAADLIAGFDLDRLPRHPVLAPDLLTGDNSAP